MTIVANCITALLLAQAGETKAAQRTCWEHQTQRGVRRFVSHQEDAAQQAQWSIHWPNGSVTELKYIATTPEYIELMNPQGGNRIRLRDDFGELQKAGEGPFRRFSPGKWVAKPSNLFPSVNQPSVGEAPSEDYVIRVAYFIPTNREPVENYEAKIHNVMTLVSELLTALLRERGHQTNGPKFETVDGRIRVHVLRGRHTSTAYNQNGAYRDPRHSKAVFEEVSERFFNRREGMTFIFSETYEMGPSEQLWPGHIAMSAASQPKGGLGMVAAWILNDVFACDDDTEFRRRFFDETPIPGRGASGPKKMNSPRAEFMEDGVGAVLHELVHMFGAHHHKRASLPTVMHQGFRDIRWNLVSRGPRSRRCGLSNATAGMIMTSRFLNENVDRTDNRRPDGTLDVVIREPNAVLTVDASDDKGLAFAYLVEITDSGSHQVIDGISLAGTSDRAVVRVHGGTLEKDSTKFAALIVDAGGNVKRVEIPIPGR